MFGGGRWGGLNFRPRMLDIGLRAYLMIHNVQGALHSVQCDVTELVALLRWIREQNKVGAHLDIQMDARLFYGLHLYNQL